MCCRTGDAETGQRAVVATLDTDDRVAEHLNRQAVPVQCHPDGVDQKWHVVRHDFDHRPACRRRLLTV